MEIKHCILLISDHSCNMKVTTINLGFDNSINMKDDWTAVSLSEICGRMTVSEVVYCVANFLMICSVIIEVIVPFAYSGIVVV